jgi:hypothetical protein
MAAAKAVAIAQAAVDTASSQLPAAKLAVETARADYEKARRNEAAARAAAVAAQADIATQQVKLGHSAERILTTHRQVDRLAREVYMSGGEIPGEIEILLQSQSPSAFATQLQAIRRNARGNDKALKDLEAAQLLQRQALAKLTETEQHLANLQAAAEQEAAAADTATEQAAQAATQVQTVVAHRQRQLKSVNEQRAQVAALYQRMLAEQRAELRAAEQAQRAAERAAAKKAAEDAARRAAQQAPAKPSPQPPGDISKRPSAPSKPSPKPTAPSKPAPKPPAKQGTGGFVTTIGTGRSARSAVAWALSQVGTGWDYHNQCLRFVDDAYDVSHSRMGTAVSQYYRALDAGYAHPGNRNPPVGAQVFWQTSNPARHIAIYAGGGMVISTDAANGAIGFVPMSTLDRWGPYLGWATPYYP